MTPKRRSWKRCATNVSSDSALALFPMRLIRIRRRTIPRRDAFAVEDVADEARSQAKSLANICVSALTLPIEVAHALYLLRRYNPRQLPPPVGRVCPTQRDS